MFGRVQWHGELLLGLTWGEEEEEEGDDAHSARRFTLHLTADDGTLDVHPAPGGRCDDKLPTTSPLPEGCSMHAHHGPHPQELISPILLF